jgi:hypothetical protein
VSWQWGIVFTALSVPHHDLQLFSVLYKPFFWRKADPPCLPVLVFLLRPIEIIMARCSSQKNSVPRRQCLKLVSFHNKTRVLHFVISYLSTFDKQMWYSTLWKEIILEVSGRLGYHVISRVLGSNCFELPYFHPQGEGVECIRMLRNVGNCLPYDTA